MCIRDRAPAAYASALRWAHVPICVIALSIIAFVHCHFGAGRLWLAYAAAAFRLLNLLLNFVTGVNINFEDVTALEHAPLWGGVVAAVTVGIPNPWLIVTPVSYTHLRCGVIADLQPSSFAESQSTAGGETVNHR